MLMVPIEIDPAMLKDLLSFRGANLLWNGAILFASMANE